jgi:DNA polymerase III delta prime subunit
VQGYKRREKMISNIHQYIQTATKLHVANINNQDDYSIDEVYQIKPDISDENLKKIIKEHKLNFQEQVILMLALAPHFAPQILDIFLAKNPNFDVICTEFGGIVEKPHRGVIPTGETAAFLLAARNTKLRKEVATALLPESKLSKLLLVELEPSKDGTPILSGKLTPNDELIQQLYFGRVVPPKLSTSFPAQELKTDMTWKDLIIGAHTKSQLEDLENWLAHHNTLLSHPLLGKRTRKGYRTLFHGPPGTGKTLTASLLGKYAKRPVFRIDLSLLVSKYIGETEKNLSGIFKRAENKNWILFFDEADALFSKRTETDSSNDRFANQEVAYLLQRVENYNGMVILATNFKQNIDDAFIRRFQSLIHFPKPNEEERRTIWKATVPKDTPLSEEIDLDRLVSNYELTAAQVSNIVQGAYIDCIVRKSKVIDKEILVKNLRAELEKEELLFNNYL